MYTPKQTYIKVEAANDYNEWAAKDLAKTVDNLGKAVFAMEYAKQEKTQMYEIVKDAYDEAKSALSLLSQSNRSIHEYLVCNEDIKKAED